MAEPGVVGCVRRLGRPHTHRLERYRSAAYTGYVDSELLAGRHRDIIGELEERLSLTPDDGASFATLMLALHRDDRSAEAPPPPGRADAGSLNPVSPNPMPLNPSQAKSLDHHDNSHPRRR